MNLELSFDFEKVKQIEFGVGLDNDGGQKYYAIPADEAVQDALLDVANTTWSMLKKFGKPEAYEPSEKHASQEYLYLSLDDDMANAMKLLHTAQNLPINADALADLPAVFAYFARFRDSKGRTLTGLRRATQFKGIVKNRLIRLWTDALKIVEDKVFKLDSDFDLLIDSGYVHILRPSGFEFAGRLQEAILAAVPGNIKRLQKNLSFVQTDRIEQFACKHARAARYLSSILAQRQNIDKSALQRLCEHTGVEISVKAGKVIVEDGHEMGFLEVLDRRRYELELVKGKPEQFRAASRKPIKSIGS